MNTNVDFRLIHDPLTGGYNAIAAARLGGGALLAADEKTKLVDALLSSKATDVSGRLNFTSGFQVYGRDENQWFSSTPNENTALLSFVGERHLPIPLATASSPGTITAPMFRSIQDASTQSHVSTLTYGQADAYQFEHLSVDEPSGTRKRDSYAPEFKHVKTVFVASGGIVRCLFVFDIIPSAAMQAGSAPNTVFHISIRDANLATGGEPTLTPPSYPGWLARALTGDGNSGTASRSVNPEAFKYDSLIGSCRVLNYDFGAETSDGKRPPTPYLMRYTRERPSEKSSFLTYWITVPNINGMCRGRYICEMFFPL